MAGKSCGTLYLCATPIGNLEDITIRALTVLKECDLIAAEDTRHTRKLLSHYDIHTRLISYHAHNEQRQGERIIDMLLQGQDVAVVSDAGMPGISDPGARLVELALEHGIPAVPVPGASAVIAGLVVSGLPTARFVFEGFLPSNKKGRRRHLEKIRGEQRTMVFYESPHRLLETLRDMCSKFGGDRQIAVARELTKKHEEIYRGSLHLAVSHFEKVPPRGEFTLVVAGSREEDRAESFADLPVVDHVNRLIATGMDKKQAIKEVAKLRGMPKRDVYKAVEQ
ncbi:16S rRNA (cytidine(1402)-2'-O)-methyltransferase [Desulfofalx alkaliphila]|uniref:16S rRNA (cytidine(1402)-2'-O)-methyltransferase n=1 Tax=Desulfofalx alkaliphila TaxID=105483 RepID=UPI0004E17C21|nr:16S rRNA (cytidine(1402)-2'-O)-methyltransferase [Desulfofalx alkaliphila]